MFKKLAIAALMLALLFGAAGITIASAKSIESGRPPGWSNQVISRLHTQRQDRLYTDQTQDRDQLRTRDHDRIRVTQTPVPQHLNSNNPWTNSTPIPNSRYGRGICGTCSGDRVQRQDRTNNSSCHGQGHENHE